MTYRKTILLVFIILLSSSTAFASFPLDFLPDGPRPRLWLTTSHLTELQNARQADSPEWQEFENASIDFLTSTPWSGPQAGIPYMALMYILTNNQEYADRAFYYMDEMPDEPTVHDVAHGEYYYFAIGYDWLYGNSGMTPARKTAYQNKMIHFSDYVWENDNEFGIGGNSMDSDLVIHSAMTHLIFGCALYGDNAAATTMLDRGWWMWERGQGVIPPDNIPRRYTHAQSIRTWLSDAIGGMYYTGWSYFMGTDGTGLASWWITLRTACGYDIAQQEPSLAPFWANVIRSTIDLTDPPRLRIHHTGDWQDPNLIADESYLYHFLAFASFEADKAGFTDWGAFGRGYGNAIQSNHYSEFLEFFYTVPSALSINPYTTDLPLIRFADGMDFLFFRSNWSTSADWGFFSGAGAEPMDHQAPDVGHFMLWRDDDFLTKGCRNYAYHDSGPFFNIMSIENGTDNGTPRMAGFDRKAGIERRRINLTQPQFAYAMMQGDDQWDQDPYEWQPVDRVDSYRRHFFKSGDYIVIFDRVRTADSGWAKYRLRAMTEPVLNGTTIAQLSANGQHKLLHRTLEPAGCSFTLINETVAWNGIYEDWEVYPEERKWQYLIQPPDGDRVNMLSVMQMGTSGMADFDTMEHIDNSQISGVRLGQWVIVFADEEFLMNFADYTIQNGSGFLNHYVADLQAGNYFLSVNGQTMGGVTVNTDDNTAYFTSDVQAGTCHIELLRDSTPVPELHNGALVIVLLMISIGIVRNKS